jgi:hypothetical protein
LTLSTTTFSKTIISKAALWIFNDTHKDTQLNHIKQNDTQANDSQHNDTHKEDAQLNEIQQNNK